jgi:ketosteroid isomerase-like protein
VDDALIETFRRIYSAVQRGDSAELQRNLAHDVEWILPEAVPWGGTHHGHLGVEAVNEIFGDHVDGLWADPDEFLMDGELVVVLGRVSGRARSSGQWFEVPFAHVWGLTDGVPSRFRAYFDTAPITTALGDAAA